MMNSTTSELSSKSITVEVVFEVALLTVICLGSLVTNGLVIFVVSRRERFHTPKYFYYLSLAVADLILGACCLPLTTASFALRAWPFGWGGCQIFGVLISVTINACLATLCIISLERYDTLSKPFESRAGLTVTQRHYKLILAFCWFHSVFWAGGPVYGWGSITLDPYTHTCKPDWGASGAVNRSYSVCLAFFAFTLPVLVMVFAYVKIYQIARSYKAALAYESYGTENGRRNTVARYAGDRDDDARSSTRAIHGTDDRERKTKNDHDVDARSTDSGTPLNRDGASSKQESPTAEENKALKTVLLLIGSFALSWFLYTVVTLWKFSAPDSIPAWVVRVGLVLALSHCLIDPLIYSIRDTKLKYELTQFISCLK